MKTLKQSRLKGDISHFDKPSLHIPINELARNLFKNWSEKEVRSCWNDIQKMWNEYLKNNKGNAYSQRNQAIVMIKEPYMLGDLDAFEKKWKHCFEKVIPPRVAYPTNPNKFISENTVTIEYIIGALFILERAAKGKAGEVLDMYSLLSSDHLHEIQINLAVPKHCGTISKKPRTSSLNFLIEEILKNIPDSQWKEILAEIEKNIGKSYEFKGKNFVIINEVTDKKIIFTKSNGKTDEANISGLPDRIKGIKDKFAPAC